MKRNALGLYTVFVLVLGMSLNAGATVCDEEDFYADFTSGVNVDRIDWWANLIRTIPIDIENLEVSLPIPDDFPVEIDSDLLNALEPFIFGIHSFDFTMHTEADLIHEAEYAVTSQPGEVTIELALGAEGGASYLEADIIFGNVTSDCSMYDTIWEIIPYGFCLVTEGIFNMLIEDGSVFFSIDTIDVTQQIDTCIIQPGGACQAVAEVSSTTITQTGYHTDTEFGNIMDNLISWLTNGMIADFIRLAFSPDGEMSTLIMLAPYLITQADGCTPPPELSLCSGAACSTTPQIIMDGTGRRVANSALYVLPMVVLFGLIIWRRRK